MAAEKNYRFDIQVLRGIAVLWVLLFHAYPKYFPGGYLGVDAFFVISGFVVSPLIIRIFAFSNLTKISKELKLFFCLGPLIVRIVLPFSCLILKKEESI